MKKSILFFTILFCVSLLYAQTNPNNPPRTNEDIFRQAELVFEGNVIKVVATYDIKGKGIYEDCYRIFAYKVHRVFKGDQNLAGDTVYVVAEGGRLGEENIVEFSNENHSSYVPPILSKNKISRCTSGIFFLVISDFPDDTTSKYFSKEKYKNVITFGENWLNLITLCVCEDKIVGLNDLVFQSHEEFYEYLMQFERFFIPESVFVPEKEPKRIWINGADLNNAHIDSVHHDKIKILMDTLQNENRSADIIFLKCNYFDNCSCFSNLFFRPVWWSNKFCWIDYWCHYICANN